MWGLLGDIGDCQVALLEPERVADKALSEYWKEF